MISMQPKPSLLIAAALVLAAAGAGIFAAAKPSPEPAARSVAPAPSVEPSAAPPPPAAPRAGKPRPGRVFSLDESLKRLDLIKPARPKPAIDFTLPAMGQGTVRLAEHRGKVVLVNFWATWCPPCLEEMPAMERLWRQHREQNFLLVAVSVDADPRLVVPFVTKHDLTFPVALDSTMEVAEKYGVRALPSSFLVGRDGSLVALALGPRHWDNDASHSLVEAMAR